jgi:hypothetical protein
VVAEDEGADVERLALPGELPELLAATVPGVVMVTELDSVCP